MTECPVCFTDNDPAAPGDFCTSCGYQFDGTESAGSFTPALPEPAPDAPPLIPRALVGDLLEAFRSQFVERRITVPSVWVKRLEALASEPEPGRRFATLVFVDLVGYTHLSQVLSEMELKELRRWFNATFSGIVERHGGFLIQFLGDAAFAAFGAPWAFERDSEAAVRSLVEMREAVARQGNWKGHPVGVSSGAASGVINVDVVVEGGRARPDLIGSPVNLAARLQSRAGNGEILVPEPLAQLVAPVFDLEPREAYVPKNYGEEIRPYAVIQLKTGNVERRHHEAPFVGREGERATLVDAFRRSAAGEFVSVGVKGEAGVGKSRLVKELLATEVGDRLLASLDLEPHHRHTLFEPVVQLLKRLAGNPAKPIEALDAIDRLAGPLSSMQRDAVGLLLQVPECLARVASMPTDKLRDTVEAVLLDLVGLVHARRPMVIVIDDLQWCDVLSAALFHRLMELAPPGLLLVLVGRQQSVDPLGLESDPSITPAPLVTEVDLTLTPLNEAESHNLLQQLLDLDRVHPRVRKRLLRDSGGVPLYITEMALSLDLDERLSAEMLAQEATEEARTLDKREALVEIFQARLDRLSVRQRMVLQCGAVLGRRFRESVLSAYEELRERLMEELALLRHSRFLLEETQPGERLLLFTPPLVRDVAYQMMADSQRQHLHATFAQLIQDKFAQRLDDFTVELCIHWLHAGQLPRAIKWFRAACQRAIRFGAPEQAVALGRHALRLAREGAEKATNPAILRQQTGLVLEQIVIAERMSGDYVNAAKNAELWEAIAAEAGNPLWLFNARHQKAVTMFEGGDLNACEGALEVLQGMEGAKGYSADVVDQMTAKLLLRRQRYDSALAMFRQVAARAGGAISADAHSNASICLQRLGRFEEARASLEEARAAYARYGSPYGECIVLNNLGILHEAGGRYDEAAETYATAAQRAEDCAYIHGVSAIATNVAYLLYLQGDAAGAVKHATRGLATARMIGHGNSEISALINLALGQEAIGSLAEARAHINQARELAVRLGDDDMLTEATLEQAWIALRRGKPAEADLAISRLPARLADEPGALRDALEAALAVIHSGKPQVTPLTPPPNANHATQRRIAMVQAMLEKLA